MLHFKKVRSLALLNAGLLAVLLVVTLFPGFRVGSTAIDAASASANAAVTGAGLQSDYLMVAGEATGPTAHVIYVLDQRSGTLMALQYDQSRRQLRAATGTVRSVTNDLRELGGGR
ncbi:MAG: hypothetical protein ACOC0P_07240 [Planctomycetota bacterium]